MCLVEPGRFRRRQNFAEYVAHLEADKGYSQASIAEICGFSQAWVSRVLSGKGKLIDSTARVIEQRLDLPEGWLDRRQMTPPKGQQINSNIAAKTSQELIAAVKSAGFEVDTEILTPYLSAVIQLYNARAAIHDGYDPEQNAAQFQTVYEQLTMQLKMKEGLWEFKIFCYK
ncbi:helix-turn-helix domain-containing protein [Marinomonas atlantica]|uniref:helix-turn-helix domain-containing protein n=1 Tax=Marinomonas atlantica TaxID=1806668 RepID=UPI0008348E0E|nr:transcriptional regulator [Marinomonas atlantica]